MVLKKKIRGKSPRVRILVIFSLCIMLLFAIVVLTQAFQGHREAKTKVKDDAERLVNILVDQAEMSFKSVDLVLQRAVERQYLNMLFGNNLSEDMVHNFNVWVEEAPQIIAMTLINERGKIELSVHDKNYEGWLDYDISMRRAEPFRFLYNNNSANTSITPHFMQDPKYENLIIVSRRISKMDGTFGGIVMAAVYSEYFNDFFSSVHAGTDRQMSLFLTDGRSLLNNSMQNSKDSYIWQHIKSQQKLYELMMKKDEVNSHFKEINGSENILSYKKINSLPLFVAIAISEDDYLDEFWSERLKDFVFFAFFTLFGSILSFFALAMAGQVARVEESEASAILASQAKSEFLANMSHELRTPLNAIIGFSEMMNSGYFGPLNEKQKERMNDINLCGNHLLHLITDILEFSKGDAGKLEIVEEKVNINETVGEVSRIMSEKIRDKNINLNVSIEKNIPLIFVDKRKLKQMLLNLLSNATKFTPEYGNIRISAKVDEIGAMNVIVADTGVGIAEEDIKTALSVFGQVHRINSHEGTGLGLPLCRMFAELHGGKLILTSKVGSGTTVRIIFPSQRVVTNDFNLDQKANDSHDANNNSSIATFKVS